MAPELIALATAFAIVFLAELPDKTMVATLVLTTRYRAWPVFVGVTAAFAIQCVVAATFGGVLTLLPDRVVAGVVAVLFGVGAFLLLKEGFSKDGDEADATSAGADRVTFVRAALTSFGVLFAAEWGDASQLATAALSARYASPVFVGLGAFLALTTVAAIAVLVGRKIATRIPTHLIQRVSGFVFAAFAAVALWQAISG
ncbi:putative Ca2+/H+ antiporter (TMEM165/GDT1 family) [Saccharothrix saharensis]|uniref:GDT1 family protein n=1 Tax=Saccharothrix saharensis TaxID=571190 RepID=A0A543JG68_9PSEU|nr:TMEM165/GDT1 family protein [Saccharothrix saharensis]TQM81833.1 putative Ca2+/H+ antiporter (TMEM165/GDT1 family) [Saccharothrix saharensis]